MQLIVSARGTQPGVPGVPGAAPAPAMVFVAPPVSGTQGSVLSPNPNPNPNPSANANANGNSSDSSNGSSNNNNNKHNGVVVVKEGWLTKEGAVFTNWKRRWFCMIEPRRVFYFADQKTCDVFKAKYATDVCT